MLRKLAKILAVLLVLGLLTASAFLLRRHVAAQGFSRGDPARNIEAVPSWTSHNCLTAPRSTSCQQAMITALDRARSKMGQPDYALPSEFMSLSSAEQLLVLVNSDRALYRLPQVVGMSPTLNAAAGLGVHRDGDPSPAGSGWRGMASNWAVGMGSPLYAYYAWMYVDGLEANGASFNIDCTRSHPAGCWGHRHNVLYNFGSGVKVALGIGAGTSPRYHLAAWTQLFESFPTSHRIAYVPSVTRLSTSSGPIKGGTVVVIHGFGFVHVVQVRFGSVPIRIRTKSATTISVVTPRHARGTGHFVVETSGGVSRSTAASQFSYTDVGYAYTG